MTTTSDDTAGDMGSDEATEKPAGRPRPRPRPYPTPRDDQPDQPTAVAVDPATPAAPDQTRRRGVPGVALLIAAAVVVTAFVAANVWLYLVRSDNNAAESARDAAVTSARERVPAMLSYKYTDITDYVAAAPENATGQFKKDFTQLITRVIAPAATAQKIVTNAQVKSAGVIEAHADSVIVLVMLDQTTTSKNIKGSRVDGSRVRVVMTRTGSTWLVSSLTPI
jgi:Mce-associated membrane protein